MTHICIWQPPVHQQNVLSKFHKHFIHNTHYKQNNTEPHGKQKTKLPEFGLSSPCSSSIGSYFCALRTAPALQFYPDNEWLRLCWLWPRYVDVRLRPSFRRPRHLAPGQAQTCKKQENGSNLSAFWAGSAKFSDSADVCCVFADPSTWPVASSHDNPF